MSALWTVDEARRATNGRGIGDWQAAGVSIDTRSLDAGDLFVALVGPHHDGHAFIDGAFTQGAAAAMIARDSALCGHPGLLVDDTLRGLADLGAAARARCDARIVAITGSVGKTGTKEALHLALAGLGPTHASAASYNNHWGVPLSLARMPQASRYAVFEIGMNHAGEIRPLARLVRPHVVVITTVEPAHLAFFASIEAIAEAKAEIFEGLEPGGSAVLNRDNPHWPLLRRRALEAGAGRIISFGTTNDADVRLIAHEDDATGCTVRARAGDEEITYRIGACGRHIASNSLAVLGAVMALGGNITAAAARLADWSAGIGRGRRVSLALDGGDALLIDESYNANPASVRAALATLGRCSGRRLAVLGDMRELGENAPALHDELARDVAAAGVDLVFTVGDLMRHLRDALPAERRGDHADDAADLAPALRRILRPGDTLLIKGSLAVGMGRIVTDLMAASSPTRRA